MFGHSEHKNVYVIQRNSNAENKGKRNAVGILQKRSRNIGESRSHTKVDARSDVWSSFRAWKSAAERMSG